MSKATEVAETYEAASAVKQRLKGEREDIQKRITALQKAPAPDTGTNLEEAAHRYLKGETVEVVAIGAAAEIAELRDQLAIVERAIGIQNERVREAKALRDNALVKAADPGIRAAVKKMAEALVTLGERVDAVDARFCELRDQGVSPPSHLLPSIDVSDLSGIARRSRLNELLNYIERSYGITVRGGAR